MIGPATGVRTACRPNCSPCAVPLVSPAFGQPKGTVPDTPYKIAHMTFFTGPAAVLGEPSFKGHTLAADEINAQGGLLGKRKIETLKADENAGTDANVKEMRRLAKAPRPATSPVSARTGWAMPSSSCGDRRASTRHV